MTYAEKLADLSLAAFAKGIEQGKIGKNESPEAMLGELKELLMAVAEQAMQTQRQLDVHEFQETLKEHGVGGLLYDAIVESINAKVEL